MKIDIDVLHSCSIKRKKPWPKLSWLGKVTNSQCFAFECSNYLVYSNVGKTTSIFI